ncbi:Methenyltetrahydromethanopterin cyclohydrolase [Candidatus Filomicrobium marinum]|uniref:Methenyltetrahydromethanopterin cyclohydrolase n=2 Tax=Filomicrobium TaxID=119044 RepID=A0A0D6JAU5_9HYPH|nr:MULTISPECIES: methenyltetrahydromethanopterin cyclohydrolase [Filomicrobium]MCV0370997.1 methenyltetrahydromethanopterin cyclohydrolase [Filomicrobium sp.]CFX04089.1 Methenyltetrahydromethanopterin cyclohydrolase [Candidatus Filomicrobium marinum]CPR15970.1 Methenyltetrahydromethanopterin cyclohydrolase [Candidatus Filomicrobium marinum]SDP43161.1 methenyltetrahydromethanopterin cyclohydrolase [Filomicrobium insigne]
MNASNAAAVSVNANGVQIADDIVRRAAALRAQVRIGEIGERLIDCGAETIGSLELGRLLGEICMGGLGTVTLTGSSPLPKWPLGVVVHASNPVVSCLASQYAGWTIQDEVTGFFALGSGPARALSRVEKLFEELNYADNHPRACLVIEGDKAPPPTVAKLVADACKILPSNLTILYAPTSSLAGSVQIAARVLEVALHKAHELHFPLDDILDGYGATPIAPPSPDFIKAMGRTNDAIIYGGHIQLFVRGTDEDAEQLANALPSSQSRSYGKPFAETFAEVGGDFYKIDPLLFSPALVTVSNVQTGRSFNAGKLASDIVDASFA